MLDLGKLRQEAYQIRLPDKEVLKINKPTRAMLLTMVEMSEAGGQDELELMDDLYALMLRIFNRNTAGREFNREEIEDMMDIQAALMVLEDYMKFSFKQMGE